MDSADHDYILGGRSALQEDEHEIILICFIIPSWISIGVVKVVPPQNHRVKVGLKVKILAMRRGKE
jgi:hypothetical protein